MISIQLLFICIFSLGAYLIFADILKLSTYKSYKAIISIGKREKKKIKSFEIFILEGAVKVSKLIKIDDYRRRKMIAVLKSAGIKLSPETYIARAWVKAGFVLLCTLPALFLFPIICPFILFLSVVVYFKEIRAADEAVMKRRKEIEYELPRFVSTLTQELKASRDVLAILERYRKNSKGSIRKELDITIADMKTGTYEAALTRFETRLGSSQLSSLVRGLVSVLQGDDGIVYFQLLSHELKQLQIQQLKNIAIKRPGKIRKILLYDDGMFHYHVPCCIGSGDNENYRRFVLGKEKTV
jgi:tight adherence protein C